MIESNFPMGAVGTTDTFIRVLVYSLHVYHVCKSGNVVVIEFHVISQIGKTR